MCEFDDLYCDERRTQIFSRMTDLIPIPGYGGVHQCYVIVAKGY